jgi:hypothetical protein
MSPIAVRERMNGNEAVVEPNGYVIGRERSILDPIANITE